MPNKKKKWLSLTASIVFFVFTLAVYAPFELYLNNIAEFWFSLSQFWWLPLIAAILLGGLLFLIGAFLRGSAFRVYLGIVFGLGLAVYLQSNFLNLNLGVLAGSSINWTDHWLHAFLDVLAWILCISLPLIFLFCVKEKYHWILSALAGILTAMQAVSLAFLLISTPLEKEAEADHILSYDGIFSVAEEENILVFVLDTFDSQYLAQNLEEEPSLRDRLDGFTCFTNNTGNYSKTRYAVSSLLSGQYLYNEGDWISMIEAASQSNPYLNRLHEAGYSIEIYTSYDLIPPSVLQNTSNYVAGTREIPSYLSFAKQLYRLVSCKYLPDVVKPFIWMSGNEFNNLNVVTYGDGDLSQMPYVTDNNAYYQSFLSHGLQIDPEREKSFKFILVDGPHEPYTIDENANPISDSGSVTPVQCARGSLEMVFSYLEQLQALGLYDSSSVIITADHGYYAEGILTSPMLLVKPAGASGAMQASSAPVSHADFDATVMSFAGLNDDHAWGDSYFEIPEDSDRERLFYQLYIMEPRYGTKLRLIEYAIDPTSNTRASFSLTDREFLADGTLISHKEHCLYCQSGIEDPVETAENWPVLVVHTSDLPDYQGNYLERGDGF